MWAWLGEASVAVQSYGQIGGLSLAFSHGENGVSALSSKSSWERKIMSYPLLELASNIVIAQSSHTPLSSEEITKGLRTVVGVLQSLQAIEMRMTSNNGSETAAKMSPLDSIQQDRVICLECHREFQLLASRHLALHGLTSHDYKHKYGLPLRQPLCAKSVSLSRRKIAKEKGLGTKIAPFQKKEKANIVRLRLVR